MAPQKRTPTGNGRSAQAPQQQGREQETRKPPVHECRIGRIKGVIWENQSQKEGVWYSVTLTRNYKDGQGQWKSATSYGRDDCLVIAEVARLCWLWIAQQNGTNVGGQDDASGGEDDHGDRF
jgi:hypothetical protein